MINSPFQIKRKHCVETPKSTMGLLFSCNEVCSTASKMTRKSSLHNFICPGHTKKNCESHQPSPENKQFSSMTDTQYTVVIPYFMENTKRKHSLQCSYSCTLPRFSSFTSTECKELKNNFKPALFSHSKFKFISQGESNKAIGIYHSLFS